MPDLRDAQCTQTDPELWFPNQGGAATADLAKEICFGCPVQPECLEYSLHWDVCGIWGGVGMRDRERMRKDLGLVAYSMTCAPYLPPMREPLEDEDEFAA